MGKFDEMVEALEENEDLVECQECFDLFPKIDCIKQSRGYICPACGKLSQTRKIFDTVEPSVFDTYDQEFPDVQDYNPNSTRDYESEATLGDVLSDLIRDEYEAIDGYEVAEEQIQHARLDSETKDDLLDTLDHIKEEEEEHIDELKDFIKDEFDDEDKEDSNEDTAEAEKLYEVAEAQTWVGHTLNGGEFVGACKALSEEEAYAILEQEYSANWVSHGYEADELVVELASEEDLADLDTTDYLTEAEVGKIRSGADKASNWFTGAKRKVTKARVNLEEIFTSGFYLDLGVKGKYKDKKGNDLHGSQVATLKEGEIAAKNAAKLAKTQVTLCANAEGVEIEDPNVAKLLDKHKTGDGEGWKLVTYSATGSVNRSYIEEVNKALQKIELANRNLDGVADGEKKVFLADILKDKKAELGPMKAKGDYTKDSYAEYVKAYGNVIKELEAIKDKTALAEYDVESKREEIEELLVTSSGLDGSDDLEALRAQALEIIGDKKEAKGYTPQSYATYSTNFDKAVNLVNKASGEPQLKALIRDLPAYMEKLNAILQATDSDATDDEDDIPEEESVEDLKKAALSAMGDKKTADEYTEESYAAYSKKFDAAINYINKQTTVEGLKKYDFAKLRAKYEALLEKKSSDDDISDEDLSDEEDNTADLEKAKRAALDKLGGKLGGEGYTEESYQKYIDAHDAIIEDINNSKTVEEINNIDIDARKEEAEKLLEKLTEPDDSNLDELKAKAKEALGEKKDAEPYTEDSYAEYSKRFDNILSNIDSAKTEEEISDIEKARAYAEKALVEKSKDETSEEDTIDLKKLKDDLADKILDQAASAEDKEKYTEESCNAYDESITALAEELDPIDTIEAFREFESKVDSRIEELRKKLIPISEDSTDGTDDTDDTDDKVSGKLKYTNKGKPREALGDVDSPEYKNWGFPEKVAYDSAVQKEWKNLVGVLKKLVIGSGAKHTGDLQRLADTLGRFLDANSSRFIFEAFKRKLIRECSDSEEQSMLLTEQLSRLCKESLVEDFDEDTVECTWCHDTFDRSECRYEVDLEWLCSRCEAAIKSRGETLTFKENNYWDFLYEDLKDTSAAVSELKDTQAALKSAAAGLSNMTSAMKEEYHKYANSAEVTAMDNLRVTLDKIIKQLVQDLVVVGYDDIDYYDSDCYMSSNNSCNITLFIGSEDTFEDGEAEELQEHITDIVEEALAQIKLPPELVKVEGSALFPDPMIMDEDDEANGITRGEITVEVTFARNLM